MSDDSRIPLAGGSDRSWLSRARPFFTSLAPNMPLDGPSIDVRVAAAADTGADVLMCFVESDGYALWPSDIVKRSPRCSGGLDAVEALADAARRRRLRFVPMWMGCHCQTLHIREHPSWLQRDAAGQANASMCLNSPFGGSLTEQVREVNSRYAPDGVYFDGLYARLGGCYCVYCKQRFRALHGHDIPSRTTAELGASMAAREHWIAFSVEPQVPDVEHDAFRRSTVADFLRRMRSTLDRSGDTALLIDTLGATAAYYTNGHDLPRLAESVDAFLLESYWEHLGEPVMHVGFEAELVKAETAKPVWWARWLARHPDGDQVPVPEATVRVWAAQNLVHDTSAVAAEQGLFSVDRRLVPVLTQVTQERIRAQEHLARTDAVGYAALLHSPATKASGYADWRPRDYLDALEGTHQVLTEAHLPVEMVSDLEFEAASILARHRVVVVPNVMHVSVGVAAQLRRFVELGGGLVATYLSGTFGADGPSGVGSLDDLFGIRGMGIGQRSGRVGPETYGGREPVTYFRSEPSHELTGDADMFGSFKDPYRVVHPTGTASVGAWVLASDYRLMDGDQFFSWYPGKPESPYLVANQRDAGRVAWFAGDPGTALFRVGADQAAAILERAVRWCAGAGPLVEVQAPPTVDVALRRSRDSSAIHIVLANRTSHDLYATGRPAMWESGPNGSTTRASWTRAVVPVAGIRIVLPASLAGVSGTSLAGHALQRVDTPSGTALELSRLDDHDVVTIG